MVSNVESSKVPAEATYACDVFLCNDPFGSGAG